MFYFTEVSIRINEWLGRLAEIAANFVLPGLGGMIFDRGHRKGAFWQMILSGAGIVLAGAGAALLLAVFGISPGQPIEQEYVNEVLQQPSELYKILLALAGVVLGGILVLGGFLWSLESAMKRWRNIRPPLPESPASPSE